MIKKVFVASGSACVAISSPAAAQENASASGLRVEALAGYDRIELELDEDVLGEAVKSQKSGIVFGAGAGYDIAFGNFVFGPEGEITFSTLSDSLTADDEDVDGVIVDGRASLEAAHDIYVGGRLGTFVLPRTLFYLKAGYSMARADFEARGSIDGEPGEVNADISMDGLRLGGGLEQRIGDRTFAKIEYRYTNYEGGEVDINDADFDIDEGEFNADEVFDYLGVDRHQVMLGFGYRF